MNSSDAQWIALTGGRPGRRLFRMTELNVLGWLALIGPAAAIGAALGAMVSNGASTLIGGAGFSLAALVVAVGVDRWRERRSFVNVGVEDPDRAVHLLAQNGVSAEPGIRGTQPSEWRYVTVQQRDLRRARAVLGSR